MRSLHSCDALSRLDHLVALTFEPQQGLSHVFVPNLQQDAMLLNTGVALYPSMRLRKRGIGLYNTNGQENDGKARRRPSYGLLRH
jgi:hypothetical protein